MWKQNNVFLNTWLEKWIYIPEKTSPETKSTDKYPSLQQIDQQVFNNTFLGN